MLSTLKHIGHLFFPRCCNVCGGGLLHHETVLCMHCNVNLPRTEISNIHSNKTTELFAGRIPFVKAQSFFYYTKHSNYTNIIHNLKYNGQKSIGFNMGVMFAQELYQTGFFNDIDILIPIPLHKMREKQRGYNQSYFIASGISKKTGITIDTQSVQRRINTNSQTKKHKFERINNVENIFELNKNHSLNNKHILLVDDVITTGATIESIANTLSRVEDIKISIASLAIANH